MSVMNRREWKRQAPPWWPEGEAWPPHRAPWRLHRRNFYLGFLFLMFVLFAFALGVAFLVLLVLAPFTRGPIIYPPVTPLPPAGQVPPAVVSIPRPFGLWLAGLFFLFCCLLIPLIRRIAVPLGDLVEAAGRVAQGDYGVRVEERGTREVRTLARAFNSMAARLKASDEQRRNLLADVTHELRTPLTVVQGNLEGMVDGIYPLDREHLEPVLDETRVLSRLIEDLRTLALADSGALKLQREPVDLGTLVAETAAFFRPQAERAGVELRVEAGANLPAADADPARLREIMDNLISNALRYTPRGGKVRVASTSADGARPEVAITVSDTGAGIKPEELPHIFDRFFKSRDSRGTGLGLAIAKDLVEAHGGTITASSRPGEGTSIRFTLPLQ